MPSDTPVVSTRDALEFYRRGRVEEAERAARAILEAQPSNFDAQHLLGVTLLWRADFDGAEAAFSRALAVNPQSREANLHHAASLRYLKRSEESLRRYDEIIAGNSQIGEAHYGRACVMIDLGRVEDACQSYAAAARVLETDADLFNDYGIALMRLHRYEEAIAAYDRSIALGLGKPPTPTYGRAWNNRGIALFLAARFEESVASFNAALAVDPNYIEALYHRGAALMSVWETQQQNMKLIDDAIASYDAALALKLDFAEAFNGRGMAMLQAARAKEGLASFDKALALRPDYEPSQKGRELCLAQLGRDAAYDPLKVQL